MSSTLAKQYSALAPWRPGTRSWASFRCSATEHIGVVVLLIVVGLGGLGCRSPECMGDGPRLPISISPVTWTITQSNHVTVTFGEAFFPASLDETDLRLTLDTVRTDPTPASTAYWESFDTQNANARLFEHVEIRSERTLKFLFTPDANFIPGEYTLLVQHGQPEESLCALAAGEGHVALAAP